MKSWVEPGHKVVAWHFCIIIGASVSEPLLGGQCVCGLCLSVCHGLAFSNAHVRARCMQITCNFNHAIIYARTVLDEDTVEKAARQAVEARLLEELDKQPRTRTTSANRT